MSQKINATDITEEEALNAVFFERADEFIKQANDFCRPPKVKARPSRASWSSERSYVICNCSF